ncbi:MAG: hypothetical protein AAF531_17720 [Actinomycetota bacterium]
MFIHKPSDRVRRAAEPHLREPVTVAIPVNWGLGLSTSGVMALAATYVVVGTVAGTFGQSWVLAIATCVPLAWILVQSTRGTLGRGVLAMTEATGDRRKAVALRARRFAIMTTRGEVHRVHPEPMPVDLLPARTWWRATACRVDDEIYFINHNYEAEVRAVLSSAADEANRTGPDVD